MVVLNVVKLTWLQFDSICTITHNHCIGSSLCWCEIWSCWRHVV